MNFLQILAREVIFGPIICSKVRDPLVLQVATYLLSTKHVDDRAPKATKSCFNHIDFAGSLIQFQLLSQSHSLTMAQREGRLRKNSS